MKTCMSWMILVAALPLLAGSGWQDAEAPKPIGSNRAPVVVELFTSEGCSSCPAADDLLASLVQSQPVPGAEIIALAQHVDYWDRSGWKDPFSAAQFTERQNRYAQSFGNDAAYTPQMVVDGQSEFVGSNSGKALEAVARAAGAPKARISLVPVFNESPANAKATVTLKVRIEDLPLSKARDTAEILLAVTEDNLISNVISGENAGRKLKHIAVVRQLDPIGRVNPKQPLSFSGDRRITVGDGWKLENLRAVILVQERKSHRILGAATVPLRKP